MSNQTSVGITNGIPTSGTGTVSTLDNFPNFAAPYNFTPVTGSQFALTCATATSLTVPGTAAQCQVTVEGADVRYTYDGVTTPTATTGFLAMAGALLNFSGATLLSNLKFIAVGGSPTLNVQYTK